MNTTGNLNVGGELKANLLKASQVDNADNIFAELNNQGMVKASQLPPDIVQRAHVATFNLLPDATKVNADTTYITDDDSEFWVWNGSTSLVLTDIYKNITGQPLALGTSSNNAFPGDKGQTAYTHSQAVTGNPHAVTAAQVGAITKSVADTSYATLTQGNSADTHAKNTTNPHAVTAAQVGALTKSVADTNYAKLSQGNNADTHIADKTNPHAVTATQVGLGNVDNTSDANKPVSTAQSAAISSGDSSTLTNAQSYVNNMILNFRDTKEVWTGMVESTTGKKIYKTWINALNISYGSNGGFTVPLGKSNVSNVTRFEAYIIAGSSSTIKSYHNDGVSTFNAFANQSANTFNIKITSNLAGRDLFIYMEYICSNR